MRRTLRLFLTLALVLLLAGMALRPVEAQAATIASGSCGKKLTWKLSDSGTLTISGTGAMKDFIIEENMPWYGVRNKIRKVVVGSGVTHVGEDAFSGCAELKTVSLPSSVTSIGMDAFRSCTKLTDISLPKTLTELEGWVFVNCTALPSVTIPDSVTGIGTCCFYNCDGLTSVTIPAAVRSIGDLAFRNSEGLKTVVIEGDAKIGEEAFAGCTSLETVKMNNVTVMEQKAFYGCTALKTVEMDSMQSVGYSAFYNCKALTKVSMQNAAVIEGYAFCGCKALSSVTMANVGTIGTCAFQNCSGLTSVRVSDLLLTVSRGAFSKCNALTDVYYSGAEADWNAISVDTGNTFLTSAVIHYNSFVTPIRITSHPADQKVKVGDLAAFRIKAEGEGLSYQWQIRSYSDGWKDSAASGSKTPVIKITGTINRSGNQYRCVITDSDGNQVISKTVTMYVLGIKGEPSDDCAEPNGYARFYVDATGSGRKYQWQVRTSETGTWKDSGDSTANKTILTITAIPERRGYQYRCKVTDSAGNVVYTQPATLYILGFTSEPAHKTAKAGDKVKFTVKAVGDDVAYQWQVRSPKGSWKDSAASGAQKSTLTVTATEKRNSYLYRCVITDAAGNRVCSSAARLTVK